MCAGHFSEIVRPYSIEKEFELCHSLHQSVLGIVVRFGQQVYTLRELYLGSLSQPSSAPITRRGNTRPAAAGLATPWLAVALSVTWPKVLKIEQISTSNSFYDQALELRYELFFKEYDLPRGIEKDGLEAQSYHFTISDQASLIGYGRLTDLGSKRVREELAADARQAAQVSGGLSCGKLLLTLCSVAVRPGRSPPAPADACCADACCPHVSHH